jgi:hypothetical protein
VVGPGLVDVDLGILLMVEECHWDQLINSDHVAGIREDGEERLGEVL